jgi:hypothetical protein
MLNMPQIQSEAFSKSNVRPTEVVAALSLATDLGPGHPLPFRPFY